MILLNKSMISFPSFFSENELCVLFVNFVCGHYPRAQADLRVR